MEIATVQIEPGETLLIVDDEEAPRTTLVDILDALGYTCMAASDLKQAMGLLDQHSIDLVLTDLQMPGGSGLDLIEAVRKVDDSIPVILITGYPSINSAVDAMKRGAVDFIAKPFDMETVKYNVSKALEERRLRQENKRLQADVNKAAVIEMLNRELSSRVDELTRLYKISESMTEFMEADRILSHIVHMAVETTGARRVSIMLLDQDRRTLRIRDALGVPKKIVRNTQVAVGEGIAGRVLESGRASRVVQKSEDAGSAAAGTSDFYASSSWLCLPLFIDDQPYGVLNLTDKIGRADFTPQDEQIMKVLLHRAGIKLENQALYEGIYANLVDTLNSLVTTIEAKDPYTRQHSLRVTDYAITIGKILEISSEDLEMIDFAGTLHDIGKIGVHDEILTKAGKLTDEEYNAIKQHPIVGEKIVEPLGLTPIERAIIRNHHERMDGGGYPDGLKGEEIPFQVRIVAVADAFDAMTTTRSYRDALSVEQAIEELRRHRGTQFDPDVVDAALGAIRDGLIQVEPVAQIKSIRRCA